MPLPIIADVFRVVLTWNESSTGLTAHNVCHFKTTASGKTGAQVYTCLNAHVTAAMWDQAVSTAHVTQVAVTPLDGVSAAYLVGTGSPAKWGGLAGGTPVPQVAAELSFATALRGPAHRGRLFVPFISESEITGRTILDTTTSGAAWATFLGDIAADATTPMTMRVASYVHSTSDLILSVTAKTSSFTLGKRARNF